MPMHTCRCKKYGQACYACMGNLVNISLYILVHVSVYIYIYIYIYIYVCVCVCVCVDMYMCMNMIVSCMSICAYIAFVCTL